MLGTRTKQVFSYGKRSKRIVNVSDDLGSRGSGEDNGSPQTRSIEKLKHLPNPRTIAASPETHSSRTMHPRRTKAVHAASSPSAKIKHCVRKGAAVGRPVRKADLGPDRPARPPLASCSPNVPGSPALSADARTTAKPKRSSARISVTSAFVPFVDVDIVVIDDKGRRISQEKRFSRPGVQVNPRVSEKQNGVRGLSASGSVETFDSCESEEDIIKPVKCGGQRRRRAVVSDESEEESVVALSLPRNPTTTRRRGNKNIASTIATIVLSSDESPSEADKAVLPGHEVIPEEPPPLRRGRIPRVHGGVPYRPPSSSVVSRPRPLTPIRPFARPPPLPSPTTPSSLDLSLEFEGLALSPSCVPEPVTHPAFLHPLLEECNQESPHEFSAFIEMFPFDPVVRSESNLEDIRFRKIGEASYSEVFGIGNVVLKVIPIRLEDTDVAPPLDQEGPPPSDAKDVLKEMIVTRAMGKICAGFVKLLKGYVVKGRYPSLLLDLWDEYAQSKGSEGIRPGPNLSRRFLSLTCIG
jgi:serine/threonine-protein kinase haspin